MNLVEMGKRIRQRRLEMALTQEKLAEKADISTSFVGHIERGEKVASLETMSRLCECLNGSLDWMVFGKREIRCNRQNCEIINELKQLMDAHS